MHQQSVLPELTPGYYVIRFLGHHFVRYFDGETWRFAEGGPPTPLYLKPDTRVTRIVQEGETDA